MEVVLSDVTVAFANYGKNWTFYLCKSLACEACAKKKALLESTNCRQPVRQQKGNDVDLPDMLFNKGICEKLSRP
jgi:hypothetical protein